MSIAAAWLLGPAQAAWRYRWSLRETEKIRIHPQLNERHLSRLRAFPTRIDLISSLPKHGTVAEVGVASGSFSKHILDIAQPDRLLLIDIWKPGRRAHGRSRVGAAPVGVDDIEKVRTTFAAEIARRRVELLRGISWEMLATLDDGVLDWVYLDAAHDFDSITHDLAAVLPKLRPGGIIAGHDYVRWGRFGYRCGVIEAVANVCVHNDYALIGLTFEANYPPSYAIAPLG
jgi:hypothetical protein